MNCLVPALSCAGAAVSVFFPSGLDSTQEGRTRRYFLSVVV